MTRSSRSMSAPRTQNRLVVSSATASLVVDDGGQLGNIRDDLGSFIGRAPLGVAYFDQTHDQVR